MTLPPPVPSGLWILPLWCFLIIEVAFLEVRMSCWGGGNHSDRRYRIRLGILLPPVNSSAALWSATHLRLAGPGSFGESEEQVVCSLPVALVVRLYE